MLASELINRSVGVSSVEPVIWSGRYASQEQNKIGYYTESTHPKTKRLKYMFPSINQGNIVCNNGIFTIPEDGIYDINFTTRIGKGSSSSYLLLLKNFTEDYYSFTDFNNKENLILLTGGTLGTGKCLVMDGAVPLKREDTIGFYFVGTMYNYGKEIHISDYNPSITIHKINNNIVKENKCALIVPSNYVKVGDEPNIIIEDSRLNNVNKNVELLASNPFLNAPTSVRCETLLSDGVWTEWSIVYDDGKSWGIGGSPRSDNQIRIQTGINGLTGNCMCQLSGSMTPLETLSGDLRVWVFKQ